MDTSMIVFIEENLNSLFGVGFLAGLLISAFIMAIRAVISVFRKIVRS